VPRAKATSVIPTFWARLIARDEGQGHVDDVEGRDPRGVDIRAVHHRGHLVGRVDEPLGEQVPDRVVEVVARRAHRRGERLALDTHLERFLDQDGVRAGGLDPAAHVDPQAGDSRRDPAHARTIAVQGLSHE
jgi:hypothetical protein